MNRLTAIGLASLVAYGLLITSKYTGVVPAPREEKAQRVAASSEESATPDAFAAAAQPVASRSAPLPPPIIQSPALHASAVALEYRNARDLKAFVDALEARRATLTADERYHLAKALEECLFTTSINEDLTTYAAKQRRQFIASLPINDSNNAKRIAAYDAVDNTQRCARFQGTKISPEDVENLFQQAAQEGDPRAQARLLVAELNKNLSNTKSNDPGTNPNAGRVTGDDLSRLIGLLQSRDPEAVIIVGQFLAQSNMVSQLRIGPNGEVPEPSAFLGAFSLVACDLGPDCTSLTKEPQLACAYGGYCNPGSFEQLYADFIASPWAYTQAVRYRGIILNAINTQNWSLIGLQPPGYKRRIAAAH